MPPLFESNSDAPIPKILRNLHLPISLYSDVVYCIALPNVAARSQTPHCALTKRIAFQSSACNNLVSCGESWRVLPPLGVSSTLWLGGTVHIPRAIDPPLLEIANSPAWRVVNKC